MGMTCLCVRVSAGREMYVLDDCLKPRHIYHHSGVLPLLRRTALSVVLPCIIPTKKPLTGVSYQLSKSLQYKPK